MDTYLHEKQINNLYYDNYSIQYIYIEIYHFIIKIIFKVNSILESFDKKKKIFEALEVFLYRGYEPARDTNTYFLIKTI